jgi:hypothetical protein
VDLQQNLDRWTYSPVCGECGGNVEGFTLALIVVESPDLESVRRKLDRAVSRKDFVNIVATGLGVGRFKAWADEHNFPWKEYVFDMVANPASWRRAVSDTIDAGDGVFYVGPREAGVEIGIMAALENKPIRCTNTNGTVEALGRELVIA